MPSSTLTARLSAAAAYRRWSVVYDSEPNPMLSLEQRFLECLLPPIEERNVVDLGCGTGRWLTALASRSPHHLIGVDTSRDMLAQADKKLENRAILLQGDCQAPPIASRSADLILCSFVLSYISNIEMFIAQLRRIARPGADIFVTDLHPETELKFGWRRGFRDAQKGVEVQTHWRSFASILATFEEQGLQPVAIVEPHFGDPEFEILSGAGKSALIQGLRNDPPIYILQLRPAGISTGYRQGAQSARHSIRGGRVGLGPAESTHVQLEWEQGQITGLRSESDRLPARKLETGAMDLSGFLILPGLVNAHDHLEFALFPRLGNRKYRNFVEWANDIYRPGTSPIREHRLVPKSTRLWWGAIRNLLCGVTTVCHHNPYVPDLFDGGFPIRVLRHFGWAHSIPMDSDISRKEALTPPGQPFILHLGEGTDASSAEELSELDRLGVLTARTVLVHGLALDSKALCLVKERGAALVWCPTSNIFLFGKTHCLTNLRSLPLVALGSDSSLTAQGDLLDELRFAHDAVGLTAAESYAQVTLAASHVLRLCLGEGSVRAGGAADLIAIRDRCLTPAETLTQSTYRDVELVLVGGRVRLASPQLKNQLQPELTKDLERLEIDGAVRWIHAPVARLFEDARRALGRALTMNGRPLSYGTV